jgi:hypothetical protein
LDTTFADQIVRKVGMPSGARMEGLSGVLTRRS